MVCVAQQVNLDSEDVEAPTMSDSEKLVHEQPKSEAKERDYERPKLIVYGDVRTLTQSFGTANGDGGQNMMM